MKNERYLVAVSLIWAIVCPTGVASKLRGRQIHKQSDADTIVGSIVFGGTEIVSHDERRRMLSVAAYWTPEMVQNATPRELLVNASDFPIASPSGTRKLWQLYNAASQERLPRNAHNPNQFLVPWGSTFLEATLQHQEPNDRRLANPHDVEVSPEKGAIVTTPFVDFVVDVVDPDGPEDLLSITILVADNATVTQTSFTPDLGNARYTFTLGPFASGEYEWSVVVKDQSGGSSAKGLNHFTVNLSGTDVPSVAPTTASPTEKPSESPSLTPSTAEPSQNPSVSPSKSQWPTHLPSFSPSQSLEPTLSPSSSPSSLPSTSPSLRPSSKPSESMVPSTTPSISMPPSSIPTSRPSQGPSNSMLPSSSPSVSMEPSHSPSQNPTMMPSKAPSTFPTTPPSDQPSQGPSISMMPSSPPSISMVPSSAPTSGPSQSMEPTLFPSLLPTDSPSIVSSSPTHSPTNHPSSANPTVAPTNARTNPPTSTNPTMAPSTQAPSSQFPTEAPVAAPSSSPSSQSPTEAPVAAPSSSPSSQSPTEAPVAAPSSSPSSQSPTEAPVAPLADLTVQDLSFVYSTPGPGEAVATPDDRVSFEFQVTAVSSGHTITSVNVILQYPDGALAYTNVVPNADGSGSVSLPMNGETGSFSWSIIANVNRSRSLQGPWSTFSFQRLEQANIPCQPLAHYTARNNPLHKAVVRILFQMNGGNFVCSGTLVQGQNDRAIIATAAHCLYDSDTHSFAYNVLVIPAQDDGSGEGSDRDCSNDPNGCFYPTFAAVSKHYKTATFQNSFEYDYGFYVAPDTDPGPNNGPHVHGFDNGGHESIKPMAISFSGVQEGFETHLFGYPAKLDPYFMYSIGEAEASPLGNNGPYVDCSGLTGGASGGPWTQADTSSGTLVVHSVNSWGWGNGNPGMGAPPFNTGGAQCLFQAANTASMNSGDIVAHHCPR